MEFKNKFSYYYYHCSLKDEGEKKHETITRIIIGNNLNSPKSEQTP